ncbi:MAG: translation initiation factor IF-2 [Eubacterium sp.]|nr:translation initiation factor IF-2 [Eubacterium sp.]
MAKVKVYELAKELNINSKDIISFLSEKKIEVKSHMSNLEEDSIALIRGKYEKKETKAITKPESETKPQKENQAAAPVERPKKKSSITAVFNPQNSQQGLKRQPRKRPRDRERVRQERAAVRQAVRPAENKTAKEQEETKTAANPAVKAETKTSGMVAGTETKSGLGQAVRAESRPAANVKESAKEPAVQNVQTAEAVKAAPSSEPASTDNIRKEQVQNVYAQEVRVKTAPSSDQKPQGGTIQNDRPQNRRTQGGQTGYNRPQSDRQGSRPQSDRSQGRSQGERNGRGQGDRPYSNRPQNGRAENRFQGGRNDNRPQQDRNGRSDNRQQGEKGGRSFDKNNQKNYQNNRQNSNSAQGDRGGRGFHSNRPKEFKGKLDREISKFNKESAASTDELRGKETRERAENRKNNNNNRKQDRDKLGKKQERFINLEKHGGKKKPQQQPRQEKEEVIRAITLPEKLTIKELADKMKIQAAVIVKKLFLKGKMVTVNQEVDYDTAEEIALEFNCIAEPEEKIDVIAELLKEEAEEESKMVARPPVVCVMGHVDHGKTSLLDAIRSTRVTDREAGGITQHIGASVVSINGQNITFLDTPGHEAFTAMRMRGANATDIAILVVAADDGVMPQTVEAINHAKAAGIEIIVAVNKIDKPSANIERVKQELSEYELIPEDWGGSTIFCPVSAHTHEGIENLLEMILLTAEVSELKANPDRNARGLVIEAQLDKGRGAVATILVQKGTLKVGEPIACGSCFGKVRAMIDDNGRRVKEAGPSTPVEILGLNGVPNAGEVFVSTDTDKEARSFAETFISESKEKLLEETRSKMSLDDLFSQIQSGNVKELDLIVKADVQGSVEAVKQSLEKLSNEEVIVKTIHGGVGAINESDVILASASNAIIIGFNVRPDATAKATAEREGVDVRLYRVIYNAIEDVEAAMKGMLDPIFEEKILGHAEVRQVFKSSDVGNIAGSYILDGTFERGCKVRLSREGKQLFDGNLASLKRFKDDVKEVRAGYECGLVLDGFSDIQEFDQIESYKMVEVPR